MSRFYSLQLLLKVSNSVLPEREIREIPKVPILKEVTSEKCNSVELNTFSTYLSSLLGVITIVFAQK
jgi:hypothetical protein